MFATMILLTILLNTCAVVQQFTNCGFNIFVSGTDYCHITVYNANIICKTSLSTVSSGSVQLFNNYESLTTRLLVLSSDVETNPGPSDMDMVLQAIQNSETKVLGEIRSVKSELTNLREELGFVKQKQTEDRRAIYQIQKTQSEQTEKISDHGRDINALYDLKHQMQLDIDHLNEVIENKSEIIDKLENDIDRLEMFSKSDTMRVFGLPELIGENDETIRQHVVDSVLKVACPHTEWERDDIKRAYRVGIATDDQPPITIVRLRYDDDKPKVFRGRAKLRDHGIRVSNDLTVRQREELKRLKLNGQKGYFYQGQLVVQSADSENENTRGRVFRSASRRLDQRPNSESAPLGVNASPMEQEVYHSEHSIRLTQGLVTAQGQSHAADDLEPR